MINKTDLTVFSPEPGYISIRLGSAEHLIPLDRAFVILIELKAAIYHAQKAQEDSDG